MTKQKTLRNPEMGKRPRGSKVASVASCPPKRTAWPRAIAIPAGADLQPGRGCRGDRCFGSYIWWIDPCWSTAVGAFARWDRRTYRGKGMHDGSGISGTWLTWSVSASMFRWGRRADDGRLGGMGTKPGVPPDVLALLGRLDLLRGEGVAVGDLYRSFCRKSSLSPWNGSLSQRSILLQARIKVLEMTKCTRQQRNIWSQATFQPQGLFPRDFSRHPHARLADTSLLSHILSLLLSVALPCTQHNKFEDERILTLAMQTEL